MLRALVLCLALLVVPTQVRAAAGDIDPTFGNGGIVADFFANVTPYMVALQPDGKLVVTGYADQGARNVFAVARYNADGSRDTGFGTSGFVLTPIEDDSASPYGLVIQPDGKIVAAGYYLESTGTEFALVRYQANGALDPTFGGDGIVTVPVGGGDSPAYAVTLQPDGKLIASGYSNAGSNFALARFTTSGALDPTFGSGGMVTTVIGDGTNTAATSLVVQPDGKIVAGGYASDGGLVFALVRYGADGAVDASFGNSGIVTDAVSIGTQMAGLVRQPDGKLVAVGGSSGTFDLAR